MATSILQPGCAPANAPTRRTLLGAIVAAPTFAAVPVLAASTAPARLTSWSAAVAAYWRAADAADKFYRDQLQPAYDRDNSVRTRLRVVNGRAPLEHQAEWEREWAECLRVEDEHDRLVGEAMDAAKAVILLPAPDRAALAEKLHIFLLETEDCTVAKSWHNAMRADAARLTGRA